MEPWCKPVTMKNLFKEMGQDWTLAFHVEPLGSIWNSVRTICRESVGVKYELVSLPLLTASTDGPRDNSLRRLLLSVETIVNVSQYSATSTCTTATCGDVVFFRRTVYSHRPYAVFSSFLSVYSSAALPRSRYTCAQVLAHVRHKITQKSRSSSLAQR